VVLLDFEMDDDTIRQWLRDQQIQNVNGATVRPLRGKASSFDILDPQIRSEWAARLRGHDAAILDCLRPILDALGLSEDKDAGRFLNAFDELLSEAGMSEALVLHHMGHAGERGRGDSRIIGWPDATWKMLARTQKTTVHPGSSQRMAEALIAPKTNSTTTPSIAASRLQGMATGSRHG
jgi:hypothetical protein